MYLICPAGLQITEMIKQNLSEKKESNTYFDILSKVREW